MVWVQYVEMSGVTIADLGVSGKCWDDLDIALAEAVLKMVSGSLLKDILYYQDTRAKEHKLMPGRAALMYVYRKYALGAAGPLAVDLQTLMHLKFNGDLESLGRVSFGDRSSPCAKLPPLFAGTKAEGVQTAQPGLRSP